MAQRIGRLAAVLLLGVTAGACGGDANPYTAALTVQHRGWDTLAVDVRFGRAGLFGATAAAPADTSVYLFNAAYDTLFAGPGPLVVVPDARLGDREPILVEVCGQFEDGRLCEQQGLAASPKRLQLDPRITYPEPGSFERGRYALGLRAERQVFGRDDAWEALAGVPPPAGYLLAYVGDADEEAVRVPLDGPEGRFDLSRYDGYDDFAFRLRARLLDGEEADVHIEVHAGFEGQPPVRLATVDKRVRDKTPVLRRREVRHLAREASRALLDRLRVDRDDDRARVYIEDWHFNRLTRTYRIVLLMAWRGDGFFGRTRALEGELQVREDGREARFRRTDASSRADDRWDAYLRGETVPLGTLTPYDPEADDGEDGDVLSQRARHDAEREGRTW
ncbi:MAG: hypothetical protein R3247_07035 [Rhodothermales bacterium]|nr:hypothetical protein [Rhodothermales bacterium]